MKKKETLNIGDYVVCINGDTHKITSDDMPELPYEKIERMATEQEIEAEIKYSTEKIKCYELDFGDTNVISQNKSEILNWIEADMDNIDQRRVAIRTSRSKC